MTREVIAAYRRQYILEPKAELEAHLASLVADMEARHGREGTHLGIQQEVRFNDADASARRRAEGLANATQEERDAFDVVLRDEAKALMEADHDERTALMAVQAREWIACSGHHGRARALHEKNAAPTVATYEALKVEFGVVDEPEPVPVAPVRDEEEPVRDEAPAEPVRDEAPPVRDDVRPVDAPVDEAAKDRSPE